MPIKIVVIAPLFIKLKTNLDCKTFTAIKKVEKVDKTTKV